MMNYLTREQKIEILMDCRCTRKEAVNYVDKNNATFYTADELTNEMQYWGLENNDKLDYLQMIDTKQSLADWNVVDYNGVTYFISFCL